MDAAILVVGGAGYIGSHMVKRLARGGCRVTTVDNLSTGHRDAVVAGEFIQADFGDRRVMREVLAQGRFDAVMHFASCSQVAESVREPATYYQNNVAGTIGLLDSMREAGIVRFIFSSTAALFGEPRCVPIDEAHPREPINPYGRTKLMIEQVLADFREAYGMRSICLRYFNAAGADPEGELGERHEPETHLIPLVLRAASGRAAAVSVFGRDYATRDGTCIRDYVHVTDLCEAHFLALGKLLAGCSGGAFNLGNGVGFTVQEIIDAARRVTRRAIATRDLPRRVGDPAILVADSRLAHDQLGWRPRYGDLDTIVRHAWRWEMALCERHSPMVGEAPVPAQAAAGLGCAAHSGMPARRSPA